ncbi:hypothetical protein [Caldivirga sp.]|uniref:hypothetical protein n=1 Tax=Caldivirga sp. TaxID=2080243 RepID=UPI003D123CFE
MNASKAVIALFNDLSGLDVRVLGGLEEGLVSVDTALRRLGDVLKISEWGNLVRLYEDYGDCHLERTWVRNKVGRRYYYYYLKCRGRGVRSIYLGKEADALAFYNNVYKPLVEALRRVIELSGRLMILVNERGEVNQIAEELWRVTDELRGIRQQLTVFNQKATKG